MLTGITCGLRAKLRQISQDGGQLPNHTKYVVTIASTSVFLRLIQETDNVNRMLCPVVISYIKGYN